MSSACPHGEFESECPGYCGAPDTFYVGNMKGVERLHKTMLNELSASPFPRRPMGRLVPIKRDGARQSGPGS